MTTIENTHPYLEMLIKFAPTLKTLYQNDVYIAISDCEKTIYEVTSEELPSGAIGLPLNPTDPMTQAIRSKKVLKLTIPKETYGKPFRIVVSPIIDDIGKAIGSISVSTSLNRQNSLIEIAEQFSSSSEEIASATEQIAQSATTLSTSMQQITTSQSELSSQVESSTRILELINNVAKSTRILGFNAGIEAARSGEHGKGFSVVAREITKLADQSAESVNEIRSLLDSMREKVLHVSTTIENALTLSEQQNYSISEISKAMDQLTDVAQAVDSLARKF